MPDPTSEITKPKLNRRLPKFIPHILPSAFYCFCCDNKKSLTECSAHHMSFLKLKLFEVLKQIFAMQGGPVCALGLLAGRSLP